MGFLLNIMAAGALFGAGYYVGTKRCENRPETVAQSLEGASGEATYDKGVKAPYQEPCNGPAVAKYLWDRTADGAAKVKKGIDELVQ